MYGSIKEVPSMPDNFIACNPNWVTLNRMVAVGSSIPMALYVLICGYLAASVGCIIGDSVILNRWNDPSEMGNSTTTGALRAFEFFKGAKSKTSENLALFKWNTLKEFGIEVLWSISASENLELVVFPQYWFCENKVAPQHKKSVNNSFLVWWVFIRLN